MLTVRNTRCVRSVALCLLCGALIVAAGEAQAQTWTFQGTVAQGGQIDAVPGPNGRVHLLTSRYYQLDATGAVVVDEPHGDGQQGGMVFPPALAVGTDGSVHALTRQGGDFTNGYDLRYLRRNASGSWDVDIAVGTPVGRNYVVGIAWTSAGVYAHTSEVGSDVWGDLHLYELSASAANPLGDLTGIWRADADARMRGHGATVHLVSGEPDPDGTVYYLHAPGGAGLAAALAASQQTHQAGTGRRGFPDLYADGSGGLHLSYGAQSEVYYNRYSPQGQAVLGSDVRVFDNLGTWHLSTGLSAVAADDSGQTVLCVALEAAGGQTASNSALRWSYSTDGGQTWSAPQDLGVFTDAGEGRRRPRLVYQEGRFFLLYVDNANSGVSLALFDVPVDADNDGSPAGEDCDDGNPAVHPGATEQCNGIDDNCDGTTDEGCFGPDGGVAEDAAMSPDSGSDPVDAQPGADASDPGNGVSTGCNCGAAPVGAPLWAVFVLLWLRRR